MRADHPVLDDQITDDRRVARRLFLQYLASSPLIAGTAWMTSITALLASLARQPSASAVRTAGAWRHLDSRYRVRLSARFGRLQYHLAPSSIVGE